MIDVSRDDLVLMLEAGYIYLAMGKFKESKQIFEGVCTLAPKHDVPQVALANVYFTQAKYLEATRTLKQAIKENPKSAFAYAHLGESQLFHGKKVEALESLKISADLDPQGKSGDFARSLMTLIEQGYDPVKLREEQKKSASQGKKLDKESAKAAR